MTLGAAVIGLGVGEQHARAYARSTHSTLRWLYDLDATRVPPIITALGQGTAADSFETMLDDPLTDVVSIASYDHDHCSQVVTALRAGKHVFVEKPMCRTLDELGEIKVAWRRSGHRHLASNLVLRAAPVYRWLKEAIAAGALGDIYAFDGDYLYGRLQKITAGWRKDVTDYSVMQGGGVHLVDLMLWLTGQRPHAVTAVGNRICTAGTSFRFDDFMAATYEFPGGLVGRISANFGSVHRHQHVVRVFGTRGTFIVDDLGPRLHSSRDPSQAAQALDLQVLPTSKGDLIPDFLARIVGGEDPESCLQNDFDVISACVAANEAQATHSRHQIEYL